MLDQIQRIAGSGALGAASGYVARSYLLANVNPLSGAAFGVIGRIITELALPIIEYVSNEMSINNTDHKKLIVTTRLVVSAALVAKACSLVGMPMAFSAVLTLQITQLALSHLALVVCGFLKEPPMPGLVGKILTHIKEHWVAAAL